jgi:hypothetical protein
VELQVTCKDTARVPCIHETLHNDTGVETAWSQKIQLWGPTVRLTRHQVCSRLSARQWLETLVLNGCSLGGVGTLCSAHSLKASKQSLTQQQHPFVRMQFVGRMLTRKHSTNVFCSSSSILACSRRPRGVVVAGAAFSSSRTPISSSSQSSLHQKHQRRHFLSRSVCNSMQQQKSMQEEQPVQSDLGKPLLSVAPM